MATITEDYVSFEIAKLLREKGFNEPCNAYWFYMINAEPIFNDNMPRQVYNNKSDTIEIIGCPTLQMAMKWLREVHNLCIEPYRTACGYLYTISTIPYGSCKCNPQKGGDDEYCGQWTTYEGACEAAIKYCLENLI